MNNGQPVPLTDAEHEELVAYLDGELDVEDRQRVERRLASDTVYRKLLNDLQRSWDMLDELPRREANPAFTRTTVELVAVSTASDVDRERVQVKRRRLIAWVGAATGFLATAIVAYVIIRSALERPNRQLVEDLPLLENYEMYRVADSVEFLRSLEDAGLFTEEETSDGLQ